MLRILEISNASRQQMSLTLYNGETAEMEIYYQPQQQGWFITTLAHDLFSLNGLRITNSPNFLRQFKNLIPFGLACFSADDRDPMLQEDFSSGHNELYILSEEEVEAYEEFLRSGEAES